MYSISYGPNILNRFDNESDAIEAARDCAERLDVAIRVEGSGGFSAHVSACGLVNGAWLMFDDEGDEEPSHEGNIFTTDAGYEFRWYNTGVGIITARGPFPSLRDAERFATDAGYADFFAGY